MDRFMSQNSEDLVRALDRVNETLQKSTNRINLELGATRLIYAGSSGTDVYTTPDNQTFVITDVWVNAASGTAVTVTAGGRDIKGDTNSQDYLHITIPIFLFGGETLTLVGASATWYIVGYNKGEL